MSKSIAFTNQGIVFTNSEDSELSLSGISITPDYMAIPSGNILQRPISPEPGMIRFNTQIGKLEGYDGSSWANIEP